MIVEYIRYRVPAEQAGALVDAYTVASESLRASAHCLAYELTRCSEAEDTFILRIEWDSADGHMKGFRTSPEFRAFFQVIRPFVGAIEEMRHYERTNVVWRRDSGTGA